MHPEQKKEEIVIQFNRNLHGLKNAAKIRFELIEEEILTQK